MSLNAFEFSFENIYDASDNEIYIFEDLQLDCYAYIFLYDITQKDSFKNIQPFVKYLNFEKYPNLKVIFVGNKLDQESERQISLEDVKKKINNMENIKSENISFFEISLQQKTNCEKLFNHIQKNLYNEELEKGFAGVKESQNFSATLPDTVKSTPEIRISLFGPTAVGKTAFLMRLMNNRFGETVSSSAFSFKIKFVKIGDVIIKFYLWDTAGQERYKDAIPKNLFQNADGILLLVDVTEKEYDKQVEQWIERINEKGDLATEKNGYKGKTLLYLIGNKIDIVKEIFHDDKTFERIVSKETMEGLAEKYGVKYFETSCKMNINITDVVYRIAYECFERFPPEKKKMIFKGSANGDEGGKCCGGGKKKKKDKKI